MHQGYERPFSPVHRSVFATSLLMANGWFALDAKVTKLFYTLCEIPFLQVEPAVYSDIAKDTEILFFFDFHRI